MACDSFGEAQEVGGGAVIEGWVVVGGGVVGVGEGGGEDGWIFGWWSGGSAPVWCDSFEIVGVVS